MKRLTCAVVVLGALLGVSCQQFGGSAPPWFDGTFDEALTVAQSRGATVMLDFYSPT